MTPVSSIKLYANASFHLFHSYAQIIVQRFSRAGPRGRAREWATLGVHPLSWLLSNNRLEEVYGTLTKGTFSSRLLLSNHDKGCTPSVAHSLPPGFCSTCQISYWLDEVNRSIKCVKINTVIHQPLKQVLFCNYQIPIPVICCINNCPSYLILNTAHKMSDCFINPTIYMIRIIHSWV